MKTRTRWGVLGLLLSSIAAAHCGAGTTVGGIADGGPDSGTDGPVVGPPPGNLPPPTNHHPTPVSCDATRPAGLNGDAGVPDSGFPGQCARDSDCTQGTNGRCLPPQHNAAGDYCTYDECAKSDDCGANKICECGTSIGTFGSDGTPMRRGNRCLPSNCRVDADCGSGNFCSPTYDTSCGPYNGIVGYYCHTPNDECTNDDQCSDGGVGGYCGWEPTTSKWTCFHGFCAG